MTQSDERPDVSLSALTSYQPRRKERATAVHVSSIIMLRACRRPRCVALRRHHLSPTPYPLTGGRENPSAQYRREKILVETMNNLANPTRGRQPLNSVGLMVCYIVRCLHNNFLRPPYTRGRVSATWATPAARAASHGWATL